MKKLIAMLMAAAMLCSLAACGSSSKGEAPAETPAAESQPAASAPAEAPAETPAAEAPVDDTVYTLVASTHTPSTTQATVVFQAVLDEITERSNGRIQFELYTDGTLAAADGILEALESGVADVAMINYSRQSGRMDLFGVLANPGLFSNSYEATEAFMEMYDTTSDFKDELSKVGLHLMGLQLGTSSVVISKTEVNDISDLAGKRVITGTDAITSILTSVGATPVSFANTEAYEALEKGTADAIASNSLSGAVGFGIQEVAKYVYEIPLGAGPMLYAISESAYNNLPADLQAVIDEVARDYVPEAVYTMYVLAEEENVSVVLDEAGVTVVVPTDEQLASFQETYGAPIWAQWVSGMEANGYSNAQSVLDTFQGLCSQYAGTCPF